jgi:RHS repeat-associated protein
VRQLTNSSGAITDTYDYDAFGNLLNKTGTTPNNYLYRSEQFDPDLGLYYLRARYINPLTGRFVGLHLRFQPAPTTMQTVILQHPSMLTPTSDLYFMNMFGRLTAEAAADQHVRVRSQNWINRQIRANEGTALSHAAAGDRSRRCPVDSCGPWCLVSAGHV